MTCQFHPGLKDFDINQTKCGHSQECEMTASNVLIVIRLPIQSPTGKVIRGAKNIEEMVPFESESINSLFDELENWNVCLEEHEFEVHRALRGPKP
jgi:hypothetical protein